MVPTTLTCQIRAPVLLFGRREYAFCTFDIRSFLDFMSLCKGVGRVSKVRGLYLVMKSFIIISLLLELKPKKVSSAPYFYLETLPTPLNLCI